MRRLTRFLRSTVGAKVGMAVTGLLLSLFVIGHLAGNSLVFMGRDAMNTYAETLQGLGGGLWVVRAVMLAIVGTHVWLGVRLWLQNRAARGREPYACQSIVQATWASRTMVLSGVCLLSFVLLHLLHFTVGAVQPDAWHQFEAIQRGGEEVLRHDVYAMVIAGFRNDLFVLVYVVATVLLGLHLSHGLQSLFQTLGLRHPDYTPGVEKVCLILGWLLAVAYLTIPLSIRLGIIGTEAA